MATDNHSSTESDNDHNNYQGKSNHDNVIRTRSSRTLSFEHDSLTSESGVSGSGGGDRTSFSSVIIPHVVGEGQLIGTYWEGRDLSPHPNIHRSHLSSSIQTGAFAIEN